MNKKLRHILLSHLSDMNVSELDLVIVIGGSEGWGKSFTARGLGRFCAECLGVSFGEVNISFEIDEYINKSMAGLNNIDKLKSNDEFEALKDRVKFRINILDESRRVLNKKRTMSYSNVKFTDFISECRALRQIHIILLPSYSDLDRYIVAWRMNFLINIDKSHKADKTLVSGWRPEFGIYRVFADKKKLIHAYDKGYNYFPSTYEVKDRWTTKEAFIEDELIKYEKRKFQATLEKYKTVDEKEKLSRWGILFTKALLKARKEGSSVKEVCKEFELPTRSTFYYLVKKFDTVTV